MWLFIGTKFHNINILVVANKRGGSIHDHSSKQPALILTNVIVQRAVDLVTGILAATLRAPARSHLQKS